MKLQTTLSFLRGRVVTDPKLRQLMSRGILPPDPPRYQLVLMETKDRARRRQGARIIEAMPGIEHNLSAVQAEASRLNIAMVDAHPGTLKAWFVVRMPPRSVTARLLWEGQWGGFD